MSTSSCEAKLARWVLVSVVAVLGAGLAWAPASADESGGIAGGEPEASVRILDDRSLQERHEELAARESRLRLWERDLTRRASADAQYFTDLEGYVTAGALTRAFLLGSTASVVLTLLLLRILERQGLWGRAKTRGAGELGQLEARVLTGLREFDGLLSRVYDRLQRDVTGKGSASIAPAAAPARREPADRVRHAREDVFALADEGHAPDEIARRLRLGGGEVALILRMRTL